LGGRIQQFNPAYLKMLGYPEEELRRLTYEEVTPERWHELEAQIVRDLILPRGYSDVYEKEYRRKDGTVFPVELRAFLLRDEIGEPAGMWAIVRDITERKCAEAALRQSEERFRQVAETVSDFIWEVDAEGLYRYTSPSVEKILGYTPDEIIGKMHFYDLFPPEACEQLKASAFQVFAARHPFRVFPNPNVHKTGRIVQLETSGMPVLDECGNLLGYRGADVDVTERHHAEAESRLLREKLSHFSRLATMGELTASIAHELNQPLAAILSNAQAALLLMETGKAALGELHEIFEDIVADDQRAGAVIRHLRALLGKREIERRSLPVNGLINDVVSIVRGDAVQKRVSIVLELGSGLPEVEGDPVQLQQVLLNLVSNACDAMAENSERPRRLVLRTRKAKGNTVLVDVADTGSGIAPDQLKSIFEPFFTTKTNGLGLGLSLSHSIVIAHNGRLWAENNPDGGATMHMALPSIGPEGISAGTS
jgi:PAS domain S-box-containing protein